MSIIYVKKIAKKVGFLRRIRNEVSTLSAIKIFNVIIKPHFEYCSTVLFLCNDSMMQRLQLLQNKAMRCILKCNRYVSINVMLNTLKWLSVKQRIVMNVLVFVHKIKYNLLPQYLSKYVKYISDVQPYSLRNMNDIRLPNLLTARSQNSLIYKGFKLFNDLPNSVKSEQNLKLFKKSAIEFVRQTY